MDITTRKFGHKFKIGAAQLAAERDVASCRQSACKEPMAEKVRPQSRSLHCRAYVAIAAVWNVSFCRIAWFHEPSRSPVTRPVPAALPRASDKICSGVEKRVKGTFRP
jgi:hypothetical protein